MRGREVKSDFDYNKKRKIGVISLVVLSIIIIVFWAWQMKHSLYNPFAFHGEVPATIDIGDVPVGTCQGVNCVSDAELRSRDTDQDGLNDWEETNLYLTSPYLEDTDSDGLWDSAEVSQGTNPNCPQGEACDANADIDLTLTQDLQDVQDSVVLPDTWSTEETILQNTLTGSIDIASLKTLLLESGLDQEVIDSFTDDQLLEIYLNTLQTTDFNQ